jgi:tetratricopeptide (TPR) repeat protein
MQLQDPLVYVARGNIYRTMGDYLNAIQDYNQALVIDPDHAPAYYNRGLAYTLLEEMQNAVSDYQKAVSIYCEQEDWENYQEVLNNLQKIQTSNPEIKNQKYEVLRQRLLRLVGGHWEIAESLIQQQEYHNPGMSDDWYLQRVIEQLERERN